MSAKKARKPAASVEPSRRASEPAATSGGATVSEPGSWLDSPDPKRRLWGKIILVGIWLYVAALWLLALDQTFNWGIFGPKLPANL